MPYKTVAEEVRASLDVYEGIRAKLFAGNARKLGKGVGKSIYKAYSDDRRERGGFLEEVDNVAEEFEVVKHVLLNNAIAVKRSYAASEGEQVAQRETKFDKKTFSHVLRDLMSLRKLLHLKQRVYLFAVLYEGKSRMPSSEEL